MTTQSSELRGGCIVWVMMLWSLIEMFSRLCEIIASLGGPGMTPCDFSRKLQPTKRSIVKLTSTQAVVTATPLTSRGLWLAAHRSTAFQPRLTSKQHCAASYLSAVRVPSSASLSIHIALDYTNKTLYASIEIMAELAAAASVIGVSDFALRGIKSAYDFLAGMKKAPSEVLRITEDLRALQTLLDSVVTKDNALPVVRRVAQETDLAVFIERCAKACVNLVEKLKQWMPNPEDPSLYRRFLVQTHRKDIIECRDIVRDTKATATFAEVLVTRSVTTM
jgi:hypothetical protein